MPCVGHACKPAFFRIIRRRVSVATRPIVPKRSLDTSNKAATKWRCIARPHPRCNESARRVATPWPAESYFVASTTALGLTDLRRGKATFTCEIWINESRHFFSPLARLVTQHQRVGSRSHRTPHVPRLLQAVVPLRQHLAIRRIVQLPRVRPMRLRDATAQTIVAVTRHRRTVVLHRQEA